MKVLLINGSPHEKGCTYTALQAMVNTFQDEKVQADVFWIENKPLYSCIDCGKCSQLSRCVFQDRVNEFLAIAGDYDGFIFASPVHYAGATGALTAFMGRAFFADLHSGKNRFYLKPVAAVVSARRAGTTAAIDQINKYFLWGHMPVISSRYWNMVHGQTPEQVLADVEGIRNLKMLAKNMVWFLRCKEAGKQAGVELPDYNR
ncbi:flavodoxin family protein [Dysosmobacter welbionis]|uniref:flavodoxin family protein n=1 Tax=Dysosmobacter welbionis TaxID=2093857 RepID=UPI0032BF7EC9